MSDIYANVLTEATLKLVEQGINPSISQIACEHFQEAPPRNPLELPEVLGGEIYDGVSKRLPKIREELEDVHGKLCVPVNGNYWKLKFHEGKRVPTPLEAQLCMPIGVGRKAVGLHIATQGKADPFYLIWQRFNAKAGASRTKRALDQIGKAQTHGVISADLSAALVKEIDLAMGGSVQARLPKANGGKPAQI